MITDCHHSTKQLLCQRLSCFELCSEDVTHLCPSSVKAKSPNRRSRKRYLGGSDILLLSRSSADCWKTSSTAEPSFVTDVFAAMYPSFRRDWRKLTIRDNTFTKLSEIFANFRLFIHNCYRKHKLNFTRFSFLISSAEQPVSECTVKHNQQRGESFSFVEENWKTFDV